MPHALIIGGTRNLGPDIAAALLTAGYGVTVLHRGITLSAALPSAVERLLCDRSDARALAAALAGRRFDVVIDTTLYNGPDAEAAVRVLSAVRPRQYVMISTGQVYLVRQGLARPFAESSYEGPLMPTPPESDAFEFDNWAYGFHKRAAEDALRAADFPVSILRLPMVNSERDHHHRIRNYLARVRDGGPILVPDGPHLALRHVFGADVVRAVMRVIELGVAGAFNIGQDETVSIDDFLARIGARPLRVPRRDLVEHGLLPKCSPFSDPWMSALNNSLSKSALGLSYSRFDEALDALVRDFDAHASDPVPGYEQRPRELELAARYAR